MIRPYPMSLNVISERKCPDTAHPFALVRPKIELAVVGFRREIRLVKRDGRAMQVFPAETIWTGKGKTFGDISQRRCA